MGRVVIGVDPHKRSVTIEVIDERETVLAVGRFGTDRDGYQAMLAVGRRHGERVWAVEGCNGIGRHVAQRLIADGESVLDVPVKLSRRIASQWRRCGPRGCVRSSPMMRRWRCGCWLIVVTGWDMLARI